MDIINVFWCYLLFGFTFVIALVAYLFVPVLLLCLLAKVINSQHFKYLSLPVAILVGVLLSNYMATVFHYTFALDYKPTFGFDLLQCVKQYSN